MNKRKIRFNAMDVLILLVVAAVVFLLLYIFFFSKEEKSDNDSNEVKIQYVVEINNLEGALDGIVKKGQPVYDAVKKNYIGTVSGESFVPYRKISFDSTTGKEILTDVEGRSTLRITIDAVAVDGEKAFQLKDTEIRVGQQMSLMLPDMYCVGYCISLLTID